MTAPDWSAIYCEHHAGIRAFIGGRIDDRDLADDLTAEVFCKAIAAYAAGKGSRVHLRGWLYRIARNLVSDHYRRKARAGRSVDLEFAWGDFYEGSEKEEIRRDVCDGKVEEEMAFLLDMERVERAISRLTDGQAIAMRGHLAGYSSVEVAEVLESNDGAVKGLLHRARVALRVELAELKVRRG